MKKNFEENIEPLISVIMPAYNSAGFITDSINSVLNQSYSNIELIVVNDGSTDDTHQKVLAFGTRVIYIETNNNGVSAARNLAINKSCGTWIAFCDADDIWFPEKLEAQIKALNGNKWSYTDSFYFGDAYEKNTKRSDLSELKEGDIFLDLTTENIITTSSILVQKDIVVEKGKFNEKLKALEDWELWLKIAKSYPISLVKKPLLKYRVYPGSTSRKAREMLPLHLQVINTVFEEYDVSKNKEQAIIKAYTICSYIAEQGNDSTFAFKCAFKALLVKPFDFLVVKRFVACSIRVCLAPFKSK